MLFLMALYEFYSVPVSAQVENFGPDFVEGASSFVVNPASAFIGASGYSFAFSHLEWFMGTRLETISGVYSLDNSGFGLLFQYFTSGDIPLTKELPGGEYDETDYGTFSLQQFRGAFGYSRSLKFSSFSLKAGAGVSLLFARVLDYSSIGGVLSAGAILKRGDFKGFLSICRTGAFSSFSGEMKFIWPVLHLGALYSSPVLADTRFHGKAGTFLSLSTDFYDPVYSLKGSASVFYIWNDLIGVSLGYSQYLLSGGITNGLKVGLSLTAGRYFLSYQMLPSSISGYVFHLLSVQVDF